MRIDPHLSVVCIHDGPIQLDRLAHGHRVQPQQPLFLELASACAECGGLGDEFG